MKSLSLEKVNAHEILLVNFITKISLPCKNYTTSAAIILTHTGKIILKFY